MGCTAQGSKITYPKINWVKSHHKDDMVYNKTEMPLDTYLNSEADKLATTGLKRLQKKQKEPIWTRKQYNTTSYRRKTITATSSTKILLQEIQMEQKKL